MDDFFVHQIVDTLDHVVDGDPRFQDRLYFNVHSRPGDFTLGLGLGAHPNQDVMDGFVCTVHAGAQRNIRLARPLACDREVMAVGPIHLDIVEPMMSWRLRLAPNDFDVSFDLSFLARTIPFEHRPIFRRTDKRVSWHQQHYQQSGSYEGWIEIGGERIDATDLWGSRDRSWGVRGPDPGNTAAVDIPGASTGSDDRPPPGAWLSAQFPDHVVHGWFGKDRDGRTSHADGAVTTVGANEHGPRFVDWDVGDPGAGAALRLQLRGEDGSEELLDVVRPILFRNAAGSGHASGFFGTRRTETHVEGEIWDVAEDARRAPSAACEVLCQFSHRGVTGFGILQTAMLRRPGGDTE